jgi:4'-phosphopantetheinyl transferase
MDFATIMKVGPWQVSLVRVAEAAGQLDARARRAAFFAPAELDHMDGLLIEKRRNEWMAGRLAAKLALRRLRRNLHGTAPALADIRIANRPDGPHRGQPVAAEGEHVGISHSHSYAAAVAGTLPVGIDIERVRPFSVTVREMMLTPGERERLAGLSPEAADERHTLAWAFKEAFMKAHGLGVFGSFADLELRDVRTRDGTGERRLSWSVSPELSRRLPVAGWQDWQGFSQVMDGYVLCLVGRHARAAASGLRGMAEAGAGR